MTSSSTITALDNPIWAALTSLQDNLAEGNDRARRFPANIGPLSGMPSQNVENYGQLAPLAGPDVQIVLFLDEPLIAPAGWQVDIDNGLPQMVLEKPLPAVESGDIEVLTDADIPAMLALTKLTNPGPFRERTLDLGRYIGIKESGRLLAMAGERLHLPGYTEISAVCTHPDAQGRGYAKRLMTAVSDRIFERGERPFLHTWQDNTRAIQVYEQLGFKLRRMLRAVVIRPPALSA